jgi:phage terminase Nu1 subunit (DNA packaging protein)
MNCVRKAEFARMRGVSRACVGAWCRRGLLAMTADGLVDVEASIARLDARAPVYRGGKAKAEPEKAAEPRKLSRADPSEVSHDPALWSTSEAVRRKEMANALAKQLEYETKAGKLVAEDAVKREWCSVLGDVKAGMLAVPSRCGARLGHLTLADVAEIDAEIRSVLEELGGGHDAR